MLEWIARYWLEVLFSCITGFLFFCIKKLYDNQKSSEQRQKLMQEANNKGTEALLRDRLFAAYNHYYERGWITVHGLESLPQSGRQRNRQPPGRTTAGTPCQG